MTLVISCTDDDTVESPNTRATAVVVDPAEFLGSFPCGDFEGAPRSYRATVTALAQPATEDAEAREEKVIGVSERLDCATPVAFTEVEAGRRYVADIEVFDVPLDADEPEPAWTTSCGREGSPAQGR
ncbi:MAG: hypothetical protein JNK04_19190, partial [Myxococcales bacterium]|nr:hypothetical protein [Myxococcales bacterium]